MTHWIVLPFLTNWPLTRQALDDCAAQTLPEVSVLLIDNGSDAETRAACDHYVESYYASRDGREHGRWLRCWHHTPPLPSLAATWNRALQFVWETGGEEALVINNDVRLWPGTYEFLLKVQHVTGALFVTATGVTPDQFAAFSAAPGLVGLPIPPGYPLPGPDFSCFLITKACHDRYPFDESFVPAFCEDNDQHRRMILGGDGAKIFGVNLPYLHYGSQTLASLSPEARAVKEQQIHQGSRAHYRRKWGGDVNHETYLIPFESTSAREGVTNPELFDRVRRGLPALEPHHRD